MKQHSIGTSRATGTGISQLPFLDKTGLTEQWAARPYEERKGPRELVQETPPSSIPYSQFEHPRPRNWPSQRYRDVVFEMRCRVCESGAVRRPGTGCTPCTAAKPLLGREQGAPGGWDFVINLPNGPAWTNQRPPCLPASSNLPLELPIVAGSRLLPTHGGGGRLVLPSGGDLARFSILHSPSHRQQNNTREVTSAHFYFPGPCSVASPYIS